MSEPRVAQVFLIPRVERENCEPKSFAVIKMNDIEKIAISKERNVRTYAEMWRTSRVMLQKDIEIEKGSHHQFIASLVFTAFTLEAYLNHIGPRIFNSWSVLERLAPKDKLNIIAEKIGLEINYGERPWPVMKDLFGFRNEIAHGKSVTVKETVTISAKKFNDEEIHSWAKTRWEKYCTENNAKRARKDVSKIILCLHNAADIDESPFQAGMQMRSTKIL